MAKITDTEISSYADEIMAQIHADMRVPFPWGKQIPRNVGTFSALHDYCDANEYLLDSGPRPPEPAGPCDCPVSRGEPTLGGAHTDGCPLASAEYAAAHEAWNDTLNAVSDEADRRLRVEAQQIHQGLAALTWQPDYGVIDGERVQAWWDAQSPAALTREDLDMLLECAEITYQSMDRPEPGTPERLAALMRRLQVMISGPSAPPACGLCGDLIHEGSDGKIYDSSGDPTCPGADGGPHAVAPAE